MQYEVSDKFELHIIRGILSDNSIFIRARSILKQEYFNNNPLHSNSDCIQIFQDTYEKFNILPMIDLLNQILKHKNPQEQPYIPYQDWNKATDSEMLLSQIGDFCRHRACVDTALKIYENVSKGETTGVVKMMEDAVMIKLPSDFGVSAFNAENLAEELRELHSIQNELKTGWVEVNKILQGGFGYGEINTFSALPGGGKSLCLMNLGLTYAKQGLNVMYFSLELSEANIRKRMVAIASGYKLREMKGNEDDVKTQYIKILNDDIWKNHGDLQIIYTPNGTKPIDLQTIVNEYEIKNNKVVNVAIVDYADLMSPNGKIGNENIHLSQRSVYEDLRGWGANRTKKGLKTTIFTASQFGKGSMKESEEELGQGSLSGSAFKSYTSDNVIAIQGVKDNDKQKTLKFLKTRNSAGTGKVILLNYNPDTLLLSDLDVTNSGNPELDNLLENKNMEKKKFKT